MRLSVVASSEEVTSSRTMTSGVGCNGPGDRHALALASGKPGAAFSDGCIPAFRFFANEFQRAGDFRRSLQFGLACVGRAESDVVADRAAEEHRFLQNNRHARAQRVEGEIPHIDIVDEHRAFFRIVEPRDQIHQAGFARSRRSDDAQFLAGPDRQVDVVQRSFPLPIAEGYVAEFDFALQRGEVVGHPAFLRCRAFPETAHPAGRPKPSPC